MQGRGTFEILAWPARWMRPSLSRSRLLEVLYEKWRYGTVTPITSHHEVAVKAMVDAAVAILDRGDFSALAATVPLEEWSGS